ncbi:MAG: response regulator [Nitrospiraceae bacterium]
MIPFGTSVQCRLILVIDDDYDTQEMLRDRLNAMGFGVVAADSGHHGLALIGDQASKGCRIDGILLNWKMSGAGGMTVLQKLHEQHAEVPVIIMTALSHIHRIDWLEDMM